MKEPTLFVVSIALVGALTCGRLFAADEERASPRKAAHRRRLVSLTASVGDVAGSRTDTAAAT